MPMRREVSFGGPAGAGIFNMSCSSLIERGIDGLGAIVANENSSHRPFQQRRTAILEMIFVGDVLHMLAYDRFLSGGQFGSDQVVPAPGIGGEVEILPLV